MQCALNLNSLESNDQTFWKQTNPSVAACQQLLKSLEIMAARSQWDKVINLASKAVLHLEDDKLKLEFYFFWICALNETQNLDDLILVANHLSKMSVYFAEFTALASMAFHFAGENKKALKLLKETKNSGNINSIYYKEALGLYLSSHENKQYVQKGLVMLFKVCQNTTANYLSFRNCLKQLTQFNCEGAMSKLYNLMHERFPFANEPYLVAALIAMQEQDWPESIRVLSQILKDDPHNADAKLALEECLFENEKTQADQASNVILSLDTFREKKEQALQPSMLTVQQDERLFRIKC